jgi:hypothetical protein
MRLIRIAICMSIKKLSKSNGVLTVCHVWTFLIGSTKVSARKGHVGLPERKSCSFFSQKLVISFITRGDIMWQESPQCVTEQCRSVRPSMTCVSSVLAVAYARSHYQRLSQRLTYSTISNSEPPFDYLQLHVGQSPRYTQIGYVIKAPPVLWWFYWKKETFPSARVQIF